MISSRAINPLRILALTFLVGATGVLAPAAERSFTAHALQKEVELGDPVEVILASPDAGARSEDVTRVEFKIEDDRWAVGAAWAPIEGRPAGWDPKNGVPLWRARVHGFETGSQRLPEISIYYHAAGVADEIKAAAASPEITIKGVRDPNDTSKELRGLKGLAEPPFNWGGLVAGVLAALALAGLAWWGIVKYSRRPPPAPKPEKPIAAAEWALREIQRRRALPVIQTGPPKEVFTLCSEVIRVYLGRRYRIETLEMTTFELERALEARRVDGDIRRRVRNLLNESDLVKFSVFEPPRGRWATVWDDARELVEVSAPAPGEVDPELESDATHGGDENPERDGAVAAGAGPDADGREVER